MTDLPGLLERVEKALAPFAAIVERVADEHPGWHHLGFSFDLLDEKTTLAPFWDAQAALREVRALIANPDLARVKV